MVDSLHAKCMQLCLDGMIRVNCDNRREERDIYIYIYRERGRYVYIYVEPLDDFWAHLFWLFGA